MASLAGVPAMHTKALDLQESLIEQINNLEKDPKCSCCGQTLPENARIQHLQEKKEKLETCKKSLHVADKKLKQLETIKKESEENNKKLMEVNIVKAQAVTRKNSWNRELSEVNQKISKIKKASNESEISLKIEEAIDERNRHTKILEKSVSDQIHYDVVYDILKDGGLKSRIIKH